MNIKNILFDLDGTLLDTNRMIIESWQHTHRTLKNTEKDEKEIIASFGEPLLLTLAKYFPDVPVETSAKVYREFQKKHFEEMLDIFPGVQEMIGELANKGYRLGVVTSRLRGSSHRGLDKYNLSPYFGCVITADDCENHKPDPEPINMALKQLGAKASETVMVGDSIFDIECARNAKVKSIYVSWSVAQPDFYGHVKPDFIVHSAEEIIRVIEG